MYYQEPLKFVSHNRLDVLAQKTSNMNNSGPLRRPFNVIKVQERSNTPAAASGTPTEEAEEENPVTRCFARVTAKLGPNTVAVLPSVIACILVQAVAAFFYVVATLTFSGVIQNQDVFSDNEEDDGRNLFIVFSLFSAFASAMCWPLIQNSGYNSVITAGTVLMLYSTLSSSFVTSAKILILPFSIFGACAYGLLKTGPQVAMLDVLSKRRELAAVLSTIGVTIGQLAAQLSFILTDMDDDANYDGSGNARWPNNMRVIEVTTVVALMSASIIQKPSFRTGKWPELFKYVTFYLICAANFLVSMGLDLLNPVYSEVPEKRDFDNPPSGTHYLFTVGFISVLAEFGGILLLWVIDVGKTCTKSTFGFHKISLISSSIAVGILAFFSYINEPVFKSYGAMVFYACLAGVVRAMVRTFLPLAMVSYAGPRNFSIALPFLEWAGGLGALISFGIRDGAKIPEEESINTAWYIAAVAFTLFSLVSLFVYVRYIAEDCDEESEQSSDQNLDGEVDPVDNADFIPTEDLGTDVENIEY